MERCKMPSKHHTSSQMFRFRHHPHFQRDLSNVTATGGYDGDGTKRPKRGRLVLMYSRTCPFKSRWEDFWDVKKQHWRLDGKVSSKHLICIRQNMKGIHPSWRRHKLQERNHHLNWWELEITWSPLITSGALCLDTARFSSSRIRALRDKS